MRFKRFTFSPLSPLIGFHVGTNPVSGQRFVHVAPFPFFGIDFNLPPYNLNEEARARLADDAQAQAQNEDRPEPDAATARYDAIQDDVRQPPEAPGNL